MPTGRLAILSGVAGIPGVAGYLLAVFVPWPDSQLGTSAALIVVSAFPILSIVFCYGLCQFIAAEGDGVANRLAFGFAVAAFATVLAMMIVQLALDAALGEVASGLDAATRRALGRGLRMIDLGLAMRRRSGLGWWWGLPGVVLGVALIGLNAATFPWPPGDRGLFDIGPFVGVFILTPAARLALPMTPAPLVAPLRRFVPADTYGCPLAPGSEF